MSTTIYSLARREHGGDYCDLLVGTSRQQLLARLAHDGVERTVAEQWADAAAISVHAHKDDGIAAVGDLFEHVEAGPRRESYKLVATTVYAPQATRVRA